MNFDLAAVLPLLTPKAIAWAEERESEILLSGKALPEEDLALAMQVGVANPEKIRLVFVTHLPLPADPMLRQAALATGLLGPNMIGLTLGYGIYICNGHNSARLLSHECRHVHQYERAGSIATYLPKYLQQIVEFGYTDAPYEVDARAHEAVT
ncbi:hypothetical protein [Hydrogenophaga sp. BPS33]|uniref:hypothetical protein n=1 Tax=Hydrogenophaga sp. BPS33 TaxID=2651974 RepID=UPI00131F90ED|nr:hypothetical protein [Hydrogenophaga sp. BPS33]QHE84813.1 hypothetical protein F9K07_07920 [Hydrogenophaga sp. BPS33]